MSEPLLAPCGLDEGERQRRFVAALWRTSVMQADLPPELDAGADHGQRFNGVDIYCSNGLAIAERALRTSFPTVCAILGDDGFAVLSRRYWRAMPPRGGDLGNYGDALAGFIAAETDPVMLDLPFLADVARLDWALHRAGRASDPVELDTSHWSLLGEFDPARIALRLAAGSQLIRSLHPIVSIHEAHQTGDFSALNAPGAQRPEVAWVCRDGLRAVVLCLAEPEAAFTDALSRGESLGAALDRATEAPAADDFDLGAWFTRAARLCLIAAIDIQPAVAPPPA